MTASLSKVIADPDWLPHALDGAGRDLTFVHVPRAARSDLTFLSDEHYKGQYPKQAYPIADVANAAAGAPSAPLHFIFHTSFCGSTLLARALDIPGRSVSLKEPDVLLYLANRLARDGDQAARQSLDTILRLLARPYSAGETVIVKPSNLANRTLAPALNWNPQTRAVLLYSSLPTLLRSLAKKGIWGRVFGRQLYRNLAGWTSLKLGFGPVETFDQTDLQIAALAWLMHIHQFHQVARLFGPDKVMLLNSDEFLGNVGTTLGTVAGFLGLGLDDKALEDVASGPVFSVHSKLSQAYSPGDRDRDHAAVDAAHGEEFDVVLKWIAAVADHAGMPLQPALLSR